jgi:hypothetical protein
MVQAPSPWLLGSLGTLALAAGLAGLRRAFGRLALRRKVADTPTARAASAPLGPVELKGLVRTLSAAQVAPFSGAPSGWWRVTVDEERLGQAGGSQGQWVEIHRAESKDRFLLEDFTGSLPVDPAGAEIRAPLLLSYSQRSVFALGSALEGAPGGPEAAVWLGTGLLRRRLREWRLDEGLPLYALGVLRPGPAGDGGPAVAVLQSGEHGEPFVLSQGPEAQLLGSLGWAVAGWLGLGLLGLGLGAWLLQAAFDR